MKSAFMIKRNIYITTTTSKEKILQEAAAAAATGVDDIPPEKSFDDDADAPKLKKLLNVVKVSQKRKRKAADWQYCSRPFCDAGYARRGKRMR